MIFSHPGKSFKEENSHHTFLEIPKYDFLWMDHWIIISDVMCFGFQRFPSGTNHAALGCIKLHPTWWILPPNTDWKKPIFFHFVHIYCHWNPLCHYSTSRELSFYYKVIAILTFKMMALPIFIVHLVCLPEVWDGKLYKFNTRWGKTLIAHILLLICKIYIRAVFLNICLNFT